MHCNYFLGFHKETGGIVAVKQIDLFDKSPRVIEALNRESKMLKYMNHPNIVSPKLNSN
jgi:serine/threonine protein kinase